MGRGGLGGASLGGGGESSSGRCLCHGDLFKYQFVPHLQEGGEGTSASKMKTNGGEALVEAVDDVDDERTVGDASAMPL